MTFGVTLKMSVNRKAAGLGPVILYCDADSDTSKTEMG